MALRKRRVGRGALDKRKPREGRGAVIKQRRAGSAHRREAPALGLSSFALAEGSLYAAVLQIRERHKLEHLGIAFYDAQTTIQWSFNADAWFHAASTMKLAVLLAVFRQVDAGVIGLSEPVHVRNKFRSIVDEQPYTLGLSRETDGSLLDHLGRTLPVSRLAHQMITTSSNFATNLLVDVVGVDGVQAALRDLGVDGVKVLRGVEDQAAFTAGLNNEVTANGLLRLLRLIMEGRAWSAQASASMLEIMMGQQFKSGIPAGLPPAARVAHKTGNISTVHHDAGIVFLPDRKPYVLVVLTQFPPSAARGAAVAEITRGIHDCLAGVCGLGPREEVAVGPPERRRAPRGASRG